MSRYSEETKKILNKTVESQGRMTGAGTVITAGDKALMAKWLKPVARSKIVQEAMKTKHVPQALKALRTFGKTGFNTSAKGFSIIKPMLKVGAVAGASALAGIQVYGAVKANKEARQAIRGQKEGDKSRYDTNKQAIAKIRSMDKDDPKRKRLMKSMGVRYK